MANVADVAKVNILSTLPTGQAVSNTFYVHNPGLGIPGLTEITNLATDIDTYFTTTYRAMLTSLATMVAIRTYSVPDPTTKEPYLEYVLQKNLAGTGAFTQSGPDSACAVAALQTSVAAKYARGHLFLPPQLLSTMDNNGRNWNQSSGSWAAWLAFVAKMATGCGASPTWTGSTLSQYTLCIFSKQQNKVVGAAVTDCSTVTLRPEVRWLRSRERGGS